MKRARDLKGMVFGRFYVLGFHGKNKHGAIQWLCLCYCGNERILTGSALRSRNTKSCGCYHSAYKGRLSSADYQKYGKSGAYRSWASMLNRCSKRSPVESRNYKNYVAHGIDVCGRWRLSFVNFLEDMGNRPDGMTVERKNTRVGYFPDNCKWATTAEQNLNRRDSRRWVVNGREYESSTYAAEILGVSPVTIRKWCLSTHRPDCFSVPLYA